MTALSKILSGLFIIVSCACHEEPTSKHKIVADSIIENKLSVTDTSNKFSADTSSLRADSNCSIDTFAILNNKNLLPLVNKLESTQLEISKTTKSIPFFIHDFLKCSGGGKFTIANPGEDWQVTDVIMEDLPDRQLIFFGVSDSIAIMAHYTGGIGKSEHILIFKIRNKVITDFWCGNVLTDLTDKKEIIKFLKKNKDKEWGLNTNIIYF